MKVDRYTKVVLTVIAVALSTLAFKGIDAPQPAIAGMSLFPASTEGAGQGLSGSVTLYHVGDVPAYCDGYVPAPSPDSQ